MQMVAWRPSYKIQGWTKHVWWILCKSSSSTVSVFEGTHWVTWGWHKEFMAIEDYDVFFCVLEGKCGRVLLVTSLRRCNAKNFDHSWITKTLISETKLMRLSRRPSKTDDVKHQLGKFGAALQQLKQNNNDKMEEWRAALAQIGGILGKEIKEKKIRSYQQQRPIFLTSQNHLKLLAKLRTLGL
ncbi:uncharacterized protein LOC141670613 isoform X2 [Apium graveolens]|uniref:uncharacterized protein LOC141670613 isoform X2 n=1 Tax=Apium graveolens TaxID=4045 RepID=UPI003D7BAD2C